MNDAATESDTVGFPYMVGTLARTHLHILSSCAALGAGEARARERGPFLWSHQANLM